MNTEQKAKAYDEALERCKEWASGTWGHNVDDSPKDIAEFIFPQLAESEDERIIVRLIEYFQGFLEGYEDCYKDGGCVKWEGLDVKSILAWLEKQKETANSFTDGIIEVRSFQRGMEEGRKLETQKEPGIKWLKSDNVKNPDKPYVDKAGMFYTTDGRMCYASEIEQQKEQKPVVTLGETYHVDTLGTQQVIAGKMPQKPAEWSEEDEKMMADIIDSLEYAYPYDNEFRIAWLKSLRPSWKPSEKQMNCLCAAVDAAIRKHNESVSGYEPARVLKSLYEDLQKLM